MNGASPQEMPDAHRTNICNKPAIHGPSVLKQIQTLSQLVTVKYVIEKVVILEDVKWFGENRVLLLAHGVARRFADRFLIASATAAGLVAFVIMLGMCGARLSFAIP